MTPSFDPNQFALNARVKCSDGQIAADLGGELAILNLKTGVYYSLDAVGASVWTLLKESRTVQEIRDAIMAEYAVDASRCQNDVVKLLAELARHGLIEISHAPDRKI